MAVHDVQAESQLQAQVSSLMESLRRLHVTKRPHQSLTPIRPELATVMLNLARLPRGSGSASGSGGSSGSSGISAPGGQIGHALGAGEVEIRRYNAIDAPELRNRTRVHASELPACDVWSLGVLLVYVLTGRPDVQRISQGEFQCVQSSLSDMAIGSHAAPAHCAAVCYQ